MKIAIIGAGNVGRALGEGWTRAGHAVVYGVRDAAKAAAALPGAALAAPAEAARGADVVVLTVPFAALEATVGSLGDLAGKVVLDATNPVGAGIRTSLAPGDSGAKRVAAAAPGARVVKAFNTTGFNVMANPRFGGEAAGMFVAGDDAAAKQVACSLAADLGFEPVDAGPLAQAELLEQLAMLWISMAIAHGHGREMAFRLVKR
ncbi:MAG: NAD(P)-binding domain-containing protein [Candidatus Eisenbacteria bacterium]